MSHDVLDRYFATIRGGDWSGLADLYSEDSVIDILWTPEGQEPMRFQGREGHRARFALAGSVVRDPQLSNVVVHQTSDSEVFIVEYDLRVTIATTGEPHEHPSIQVMTIRNGEIAHSRDYHPTTGDSMRNALADASRG